MELKICPAIDEIDAEQWNQLRPDAYPFLRHEFLAALEHSGSVGKNTGWQPQHLAFFQDNTLVAAVPMYLKMHSYGEYVFDWEWANAYQRHRLDYYPKLLTAIPFTPAQGPRLLLSEQVDKQLWIAELVATIQHLSKHWGLSGWHLLFPEPQVNQLLVEHGCLQRQGYQFHWNNRNYQSFDDFLATFTARKRKNVRKERQQVQQQGLEIEALEGELISEQHIQHFYHCYQGTYLKRSGHQGYLTEAFFQQIHQTMADQLMMVVARHNGQQVASALYFKDNQTLYGRYWGATEDFELLHFEACYYQGIEYAIKHKLSRFDAGAQGEHKIQRGFEPTATYSNHWLSDHGFQQAIERWLDEEKLAVDDYLLRSREQLPFNANSLAKWDLHKTD